MTLTKPRAGDTVEVLLQCSNPICSHGRWTITARVDENGERRVSGGEALFCLCGHYGSEILDDGEAHFLNLRAQEGQVVALLPSGSHVSKGKRSMQNPIRTGGILAVFGLVLALLVPMPARANPVTVTGNVSVGKAVIDLFPIGKAPERPTAIMGQLTLNLNNVGPLNFHYIVRHPFYSGHEYWTAVADKEMVGFTTVPLNDTGTRLFADWERNFTTGRAWAWFGVCQPFKL